MRAHPHVLRVADTLAIDCPRVAERVIILGRVVIVLLDCRVALAARLAAAARTTAAVRGRVAAAMAADGHTATLGRLLLHHLLQPLLLPDSKCANRACGL